jgi:hypothetical protein
MMRIGSLGATIVLLACIFAVSWWGARWLNRGAAWLVVLVLLTLFAGVVGQAVSKHPFGLLIDERNKMSLARFQTALWTVVVLAAFVVAALWNVRTDTPGRQPAADAARPAGPLEIAVPQELWLALGISATALIGSALIKGAKANQRPPGTPGVSLAAVATDALGTVRITTPEGQVNVQGKLHVKRGEGATNQPDWTDMFKGDEAGNYAYLDLSKLQMFFFTLILVLTYAVAITKAFGRQYFAFPDIDEGFVTLLAISQGTYLATKAAPHTPDPPNPPTGGK